MNIKIVAVGNIKEHFIRNGIEHYLREMDAKHSITLIEVKEEKFKEPVGAKIIEQIKIAEGKTILTKITNQDIPIPLVINGKKLTSLELFNTIEHVNIEQNKTPCFIIGGSFGLSDEIIRLGHGISFSKMTFPHQLIRFIFLSHLSEILLSNNSIYRKFPKK